MLRHQFAKSCGRNREPIDFERVQDVGWLFGWISQISCLVLDGSDDGCWIEVDDVSDEGVGMLRLKVIGAEGGAGKVAEVERDDDLSTTADGGCEDMPIVCIGKDNRINQRRVVRHNAVRHGGIHQVPGASKRRGSGAWAVLRDVAKTLVENRLGPFCTEQPSTREPDEKIAKRRRVEHARVVDSGERNCSVFAGVLTFGGKLGENLSALIVVHFLVCEQIRHQDASTGSDQSMRNLAGVEQSDEIRTRYIE